MSAARDGTALAAELDRLLRACIQCGLCLPHCATYLATGNEAQSPRGRLVLLKQMVAEPGRRPDAATLDALDLCLGCLACVSACPSGIRAELLEEAKARGHAARRGAAAALASRLLSRRGVLAALRPAARLAAAWRWDRPAAAGLAATLPASLDDAGLRHLLDGLIARGSARVAAPPAAGPPPPLPALRVALFTGCANAALLPHAQQRLRALLTAAGCAVMTPDGQACCGALAAHAGQPALAARQARANGAALGADPDAVIVVEAAGCGRELRQYPPAIAARVRDATVLLAGLPLPPPRALPLRVACHDPCHARHGQGIVEEPRVLLARLPGLTLVEPEEAEVCCGSGGPYALLHPELSRAMGRRKAEQLAATGADLVVTGNPGCLGQIRAALRRVAPSLPVLPLTDLLWYAHLSR